MKPHDRMVPTRVTTFNGYKADEYPQSFLFDDGRLTVVEVEDRWYSPCCSYFRVFADDAGRYILRQDRDAGVWQTKRI